MNTYNIAYLDEQELDLGMLMDEMMLRTNVDDQRLQCKHLKFYLKANLIITK